MRVLQKLDKEYVKQLRKDFKAIAKGPQTAVRQAIPSKARPPMSQMRQVHFGRLAWGTTYSAGGKRPKPAKSVLIQTPNTKAKKYKEREAIPIVRLQVGSPGTVLFDMAYRINGRKGRRGLTRPYDYMYTIGGKKVPGKRQHTVVPLAFAKGIAQSTGRLQYQASRIVWPAAEKAMPAATAAMDKKITEVNMKISAELKRKS